MAIWIPYIRTVGMLEISILDKIDSNNSKYMVRGYLSLLPPSLNDQRPG